MSPLGKLSDNPAMRRWMASSVITLVAWMLALLPLAVTPTRAIRDRADAFFYDTYYRLRRVEDQTHGPVIIVAVDDRSLKAVDEQYHFGWHWPREFLGYILAYLDQAGAKAVAFDVLFSETSTYQGRTGDDDKFADLVADARTPIVFGSMVSPDGAWERFAPPVKSPTLGAVNVGNDKVVYRRYTPTVNGRPSLAVATLLAAGQQPRVPTGVPFLLHYYGPHQTPAGQRTFRYISAASVLGAQLQGPEAAKAAGITPDLFRGKIVLIGGTAAATYDLKSSPLADQLPGVEVQATALANLLDGQQVSPVAAFWSWLAPLLCAAFTTLAVIVPRRATLKLLGPILTTIIIIGLGVLLFRGGGIRWFAPVSPLFAMTIATLGAFSWTYFAEDRQRRFMLKALSKVVSPAVAEQLAREPHRLALGTIRTDLTVLFTDLANFTGECEAMDVEKLTPMLNRYLGEMSDQVLKHDGTLDKYIGDAIMCFWNAPLPQADHAVRACRAALAMGLRESQIKDELRGYGVKRIFTRIGINTATVAVGFIGSDHLFNYTALGDGVNLASRLEGANKLYGTRILISQATADLVKDHFLLRKIGALRVKGKTAATIVYELLAEKGQDGQLEQLARGYEEALMHFQSRQWDEAQRRLLDLQGRFANDGASRLLLAQIEHFRDAPPPEDWDGVYVAKDK